MGDISYHYNMYNNGQTVMRHRRYYNNIMNRTQ